MKNNFAKNLIKLRSGKQFSQEKLAAELGVSRQTITSWENGKAQPSTENLAMLAKIFNITIDRLVVSDYKKNAFVDLTEKGFRNTMNNQRKAHRRYQVIETILTCIWSLIALIYLAIGFITDDWGSPLAWGIFPLYAIIYTPAIIIADLMYNKKD